LHHRPDRRSLQRGYADTRRGRRAGDPLAGRSLPRRRGALLFLDLDNFKRIIDRNELLVGASIGITVYPTDGDDVISLLRNADSAMYRTKEQGRNNHQFFNSGINEAATRRFALERKLCRAFEDHELRLYYQPQLRTDTRR
jgi:GGDEF domain-containing protein